MRIEDAAGFATGSLYRPIRSRYSDASIVHGEQTITIVVTGDNVIKRKPAGKVRVEGSDRTGPLELSTNRPAADTPDTSIAHGG